MGYGGSQPLQTIHFENPDITNLTTQLAQNSSHRMNWINVVQNGVKNDGTDCTSTLASLMSANLGSVFYFPKGTYLLSATLPYLTTNTSLIGESGTIITLSSSYVSDGLNCLFRVPQYNNSSASIVSNVTVKGIEFHTNWQSTTLEAPYFLGLWCNDQFIIEDCKFLCSFTNSSGDTIDVRGGCSNGIVRNCYFENLGEVNNSPATGGSFMLRNYHTSLDNHDIIITNCTFHKVGVDETLWIAVSSSAPNQNVANRDILIVNNRFICDAGTTTSSTTKNPDCFITLGVGSNKNQNRNILFAHNEIRCATINETVIRAFGENINIFNNPITYTTGTGGNDRNIEVLANSGKVQIKGNTIISTGSKYGINIGSNSETVVQHNSITFTGISSSSVIFGSNSLETIIDNYINATTAVDICENILRVIDNQIILNGVTNIVQNVRDMIGNRVTCSSNPTYIYANFQSSVDQVIIKRNVVRGTTGGCTIRSSSNPLQRISICDNEFDNGNFNITSMTLAVVMNNVFFTSNTTSANVASQVAATTLQCKNNLFGSNYVTI